LRPCRVQAWSAEIGEDGLHKQDWFALTFRDVAEDIEAAREEGKRLVMIFEQRGCIYCAQMHEKILSDPEVADFIKANFKVVQYNMFGDEEVTDLDGDVLTEKTAARKWGYVFTPTMMFLPEEEAGRQDSSRSGRRNHAGRLREMDISQYVQMGCRERL
jgi:hypothetical protein